jgi:hypothetical protein
MIKTKMYYGDRCNQIKYLVWRFLNIYGNIRLSCPIRMNVYLAKTMFRLRVVVYWTTLCVLYSTQYRDVG